MTSEIDNLKQLAQQMVSDQAVQIELRKSLSSAMLGFAQDAGVVCTAEELSQAIAEAMAPAQNATAGDSPSWYRNAWLATQYYVCPSDLATLGNAAGVAEFLVRLRGGSDWDQLVIQWMFGNPENAGMILVLNVCMGESGSGVLITSPLALPAFSVCCVL